MNAKNARTTFKNCSHVVHQMPAVFLRPPYPTAASVMGGSISQIDYEDEEAKGTRTQWLLFQPRRTDLGTTVRRGVSCFWTELGVHIRMAVSTQAARLRTFVGETPGGRWAQPWETPWTHSAPPWENPGRGDGSFSIGLTVRSALAGIRAVKGA